MTKNKKYRFETDAILNSAAHQNDSRPVSHPIYLSTTYHRNEDGGYNNDFVYSRHSNPNRQVLEKSLAAMEGCKYGFAFASGMAAASSIFQCLKAGDHVLVADDVYFNIYLLLNDVFKDWNLEYTLVDMTNLEQVESSIKKNTALIWLESPSNPLLKISDISAISSIAKTHDLLLAVDNTWPTPVLQKSVVQGADIVMHSTTKYFGGHSDVLGGCVLVNDEKLAEKLGQIQTLSGAVPSPFDCWLISRGMQTLHLRVMAQSKSAIELALLLESHDKIEKVNYPGLTSHPGHEVASRQMENGFGGMLSVLIKGDKQHAIDVSNRLKLFTVATSLGGVESLVEHRESVEGPDSQTPENLLRISVGLENVQDLIEDWEEALG